LARIGIDARLTYYTQGGIAQYTQHLVRAFAQIESHHRFLILHSRKDARNMASGEAQQRVACWTPAHHRLERLALACELLPLGLDVLHSPDFIPPLNGCYRSVITIHDLAFLRYPRFLTADARRYYNNQIASAVKRAERIIAVSRATRDDVLDLLGVPPDRVTVIYEAAGEQFRPLPTEDVVRITGRYSLPPGYILFVSTIEPRKNVDGLLRAYAQLGDALPDAPPLVLAGKRGWLYEDTLALVETLGLRRRVIWLETFDYADLPAIYGGAAAFCLPSFYEGFGLPPLEAMACGTPVVVSQRASLPEIVGNAALLIEPDDPGSIAAALSRVLTDTGLATHLRSEGLRRAAQFSWHQAAEQTLAAYEHVLAAS
jgi:glycosyltransferase involved in cell wall biosynthesis